MGLMGKMAKRKVRSAHLRPLEALENRLLYATFTVTTAVDSGAGSLRQAILSANATPGADTVAFKIGTGLQTIAPLTALPAVNDPLTLDATTQPGYAGKPLIQLTGSRLPIGNTTSGLIVTAGASTVRGLVINRFGGNGVMLMNNGGNTIAGCFIGTDATGAAAAPNGGQGVFVQSPGNVIGGSGAAARNVISGNAKSGIQLYTTAASGNSVRGNYIGTNAAGTAAVANGKCGVSVGSPNNTIGGPTAGWRNVISGNGADGVIIAGTGATKNTVIGNYIGTDAAGSARLGNVLYGVEISQPNNTVGGTLSALRNVISGNVKSGVVLYLSTASGNKVIGNFIGTDATGRRDLGNGARGVDVTYGASDNFVGGSTAGSGNVISGNDAGGVGSYNASPRNSITGNFIGTDLSGLVPLANAKTAVSLSGGLSTIVRGNTICYVGTIAVQSGSTSGNTITSNVLLPVLL